MKSAIPKKTIFVLYIPGGAMLGLIPAVVLARIEELTETPSAELFQAFDGVSTGSILAAGLNVPGITGADGVEMFCSKGPGFFPDTLDGTFIGRKEKMVLANIANLSLEYFDPAKSDELIICELKKLGEDLRGKLPAEKHIDIDKLLDTATQRWLTGRRKRNVLKACENISKQYPDTEGKTVTFGELVVVRTSSNALTNIFKRAVVGFFNTVKYFCPPDSYLYKSDPPKAAFQGMFGERRMSDSLKSLYISSYDARNNKVITFFSRKKDFFSNAPDTPCETSPGNHKLWDAVMASTANPYAFAPHRMEDGIVCVDKAIIHPPFSAVQDILEHKPEDAIIKLIILGTGKYLSHLPDDMIIEHYKSLGVLGNLMKGREIAELEGYMMSVSRSVLNQVLGKDNIIEITPRLAPQTYSEAQDFPSRDTLDASEENIKKILKQARALLVEQDDTIRSLSQMLVDNLHLIGHMNDEKYQRVSNRIGVKTEAKPLESGIGKEIPGMYERMFGQRGLAQLFRKISAIIAQEDGNSPLRPPPAPQGPGGPKPDEPKGP